MDIIRRKTDYGLRALVAIAQADRPLRAEELAEQEGAPVAFLHKALTDLANAGILEGQRGPAGGFTMARPPARVTLLQAVEAMQGPLAVSRCLLGDNACARQQECWLRFAWEMVQHKIASFLRGLTVEDLMKSLAPAPTRLKTKRAAAAATRLKKRRAS
jgi:Rrf2 family protein